MPIFHRAIAVINHGKTPLMAAVIRGDTAKVKVLIAEGANANEQDEQGWTALQLAAAYGHIGIVKALLAKDADPNIRNRVGRTALMYAAALGYTSIVKALLDRGADPNAASCDDPEDTDTGEPLFTLEGETALMLAAWSGHTDIIRLLINAGADVNAKGGPLGGTALHSALWEGFATSVRALSEAPDLDLSQTDQEGLTAKEIARKKGHEKIARMLEAGETARLVKAS